VHTLSQIEEKYGEFVVSCAFGSSLSDVMSHIAKIAKKHTLVYPDLPVAGDEIFSKSRFLERFSEVQEIFNLLADEQSRRVLEGVFAFKITGDISWLLPIFTDGDSDFAEIVNPGDDEIYADLGAYNGDTAARFIGFTGGRYGRIYAFEPDKRSFRKCVRNLIGCGNVTFVNSCAWKCDDILGFSQSAGRQSQISDTGSAISARSLDSVLCGNCCTVIKYDVEGSEREAIKGSERTICKFSPKMIISVYHRPFDLIDIPKQVRSIDGGYKIYLRQTPYFPAWDTLVYAKK
jgi:FkbM family methyltransferase